MQLHTGNINIGKCPCCHCIGGSVSRRANFEVVAEEKILFLPKIERCSSGWWLVDFLTEISCVKTSVHIWNKVTLGAIRWSTAFHCRLVAESNTAFNQHLTSLVAHLSVERPYLTCLICCRGVGAPCNRNSLRFLCHVRADETEF